MTDSVSSASASSASSAPSASSSSSASTPPTGAASMDAGAGASSSVPALSSASSSASELSSPTRADQMAAAPTTAEQIAASPNAAELAVGVIPAVMTSNPLASAPDALVEPVFYQGPSVFHSMPLEDTHVGMTEDAGRFNRFNDNFSAWAADRNAQTDYNEYSNDAAHAYNGSGAANRDGAATLDRAQALGERVDAAVDRYKAATDPAAKQAAAREIATEFGRYQHMVQDNWAHGGVDAAQHYAQHVDENAQSIAAAQREARLSFAEFGAYLESKGVDPGSVDPGARPSYDSPYASGAWDWATAGRWDGVDRSWDRDAMAGAIRERFNQATPMGSGPSSL